MFLIFVCMNLGVYLIYETMQTYWYLLTLDHKLARRSKQILVTGKKIKQKIEHTLLPIACNYKLILLLNRFNENANKIYSTAFRPLCCIRLCY